MRVDAKPTRVATAVIEPAIPEDSVRASPQTLGTAIITATHNTHPALFCISRLHHPNTFLSNHMVSDHHAYLRNFIQQMVK